MPAGPGTGASENEGASEAPRGSETPTPVLLRGDVDVGVAWVCARGPEFTNATGLKTREKGHSECVRVIVCRYATSALSETRTTAAWMLLEIEEKPA